MRIASFDIGKKNFAFCIEEFDEKEVMELQIPKTPKEFTEEYTDSLKTLYGKGTIVLLDNIDITTGCTSKKILDRVIFDNMYKVLDSYYDSHFSTCSVVIIEQQMSFGNKKNVMALRLGQHCYSYFVMRGIQTIHEFPAFHKTKVFTDKKLTDYSRKKWAVNFAYKILEERNDTDHYALIESRKKKDDLSDVIVQLQAFKYLLNQKKIKLQ